MVKNDFTIILNKTLTSVLKNKGITRDLIRRIQLMRKELNLEYSAKISVWISTEDSIKKESITEFKIT